MVYRLLFLGGKRKGEYIPIPEGRVVTIGRSPSNDICIPDSKMSRIHCQIEIVDGVCTITDLNSTNGTFVGGERVQEKELSEGDRITFGLTRLRFEEAQEEAPAKAGKKRVRRKAAPMLILCNECGATILQSDIESGAAKQIGSGFYCGDCAGEFADVEVVEEAEEPGPLPPYERIPIPGQGAVETVMTMDPLIGETLGGCRIIEKLAEGRISTLYKAEQVAKNRSVAMKIISQSISNNEEWVKRFLRDGDVGGRLSHPNIVVVYDTGKSRGFYYVCMEFVEGQSVHDMLARDRTVALPKALNIIRQLAYALEYANGIDVVHQDIRPANILVSRSGVTKLSDYGLAATLTADQGAELLKAKMGAVYLRYCAPELLKKGGGADIRSDIYSTGAVLYHMLTGRPPVVADSTQEMIRGIRSGDIPSAKELNPEIPDAMQRILDTCLAPKEDERYQRPADLIDALEHAGED